MEPLQHLMMNQQAIRLSAPFTFYASLHVPVDFSYWKEISLRIGEFVENNAPQTLLLSAAHTKQTI